MNEFDTAAHQHRVGKKLRTHVHAWGKIPHQHLLRAICHLAECVGYESHDIHPTGKEGGYDSPVEEE